MFLFCIFYYILYFYAEQPHFQAVQGDLAALRAHTAAPGHCWTPGPSSRSSFIGAVGTQTSTPNLQITKKTH